MVTTKEKALRDFLNDELMAAIAQKERELRVSVPQTEVASWKGYADRVRVLIENLDVVLTPRLPADEEDVNRVRLHDLKEGVTFRNCVEVLRCLAEDPYFDEELEDMIDVWLSELV